MIESPDNRRIARHLLRLAGKEWTIEEVMRKTNARDTRVRTLLTRLFVQNILERRLETVGDDFRFHYYKFAPDGVRLLNAQLEEVHAAPETETSNLASYGYVALVDDPPDSNCCIQDATLRLTLPPYVVAGRWKDPDGGSRSHPYDFRTACLKIVNGQKRIYPNKEAADAAIEQS